MSSRQPLLIEAIPARLDGKEVTILDIDDTGALIEHSIPQLASPPAHRLQFVWNEEEMDLPCRADGSILQDLLSDQRQKLTWHARVEFEPSADLAPLRRAIESYRGGLARAQEANLGGESAAEPPSVAMLRVGEAIRDHKPGYMVCVYRDGKWSRRASRSPSQPFDGFTIAEFEDEQQIELLMKAYEEADRQGRELIRQFAAASLE